MGITISSSLLIHGDGRFLLRWVISINMVVILGLTMPSVVCYNVHVLKMWASYDWRRKKVSIAAYYWLNLTNLDQNPQGTVHRRPQRAKWLECLQVPLLLRRIRPQLKWFWEGHIGRDRVCNVILPDFPQMVNANKRQPMSRAEFKETVRMSRSESG